MTHSVPSRETDRRVRNNRRGDMDEPIICCCPKTSRFATPRCRAHIQFTFIATLQCLILMSFVIYDLIDIAQFKQRIQSYARGDNGPGHTDKEFDDMTPGELVRRHNAYRKQEGMAIALLLLLFLLIAASVTVYIGYKKKQSLLLLPFLILTFPVLTFAMIYAILFRVEGAGTIVYVKIITVVIIYTILANIYRAVYRLYRCIKYGNLRRSNRDAENDDIYSVSHNMEPVVLRMKPPPYEKEPPPYSITAPDTSTPPYSPTPMENENCFNTLNVSTPPYSPPNSETDPNPANNHTGNDATDSSLSTNEICSNVSDSPMQPTEQSPPAYSNSSPENSTGGAVNPASDEISNNNETR